MNRGSDEDDQCSDRDAKRVPNHSPSILGLLQPAHFRNAVVQSRRHVWCFLCRSSLVGQRAAIAAQLVVRSVRCQGLVGPPDVGFETFGLPDTPSDSVTCLAPTPVLRLASSVSRSVPPVRSRRRTAVDIRISRRSRCWTYWLPRFPRWPTLTSSKARKKSRPEGQLRCRRRPRLSSHHDR